MNNQSIVNSIFFIIQEFRNDKIFLREMLDKIEILIHSLSLDYNSKEKILETWDIMEEIYAGAADEGRSSLSLHEMDVIFKTLDQLAEQVMKIVESRV